MKLKSLKNAIGNYNIFNPSQKMFRFSIAIVDNNNKVIEEDGIQAKLDYIGDIDDKDYFSDYVNNLGDIFTRCFAYGKSNVLKYEKQCLLFAKVYTENHRIIAEPILTDKIKQLKEEIEKAQINMKYIEYFLDISDDINEAINQEIISINKSIEYYNKELSELKETSERYDKVKIIIEEKTDRLKYLGEHLIQIQDTEI